MADVKKEDTPTILFSNNNDISTLRHLLKSHSLPQHGRKFKLLARLTLLSCLREEDSLDRKEPVSIVIKRFEGIGLVNETACLWGATTAKLMVEADRLGVTIGEGTKEELIRDIMLKRIMKSTSYRNAMMGIGIRDATSSNDWDRVNTEIQIETESIDSKKPRGLASSIHAFGRKDNEDGDQDSSIQRFHSGGNDIRVGGGRGMWRGGRVYFDNGGGGGKGMGRGMRGEGGMEEGIGIGTERLNPNIQDAVNGLGSIMENGQARLFSMIEEHRRSYTM